MKKLTCECGYMATGETDEAVIANLVTHAETKHPDTFREMSIRMTEVEMESWLREKIEIE